jgi:hypothetical protein
VSGAGGRRRLRLPRRHPADQGAIEAYFSGRWLDPDLVALAGFADDARRLARGPGPVPSTPLAQLFADGFR